MSSSTRHAEWLSLVETSGPFLVPAVLNEVFPQGLEAIESSSRKRLRSAYDEWAEALDNNDPDLEALHREWIRLALQEFLEFEESVFSKYDQKDISLTYKSPEVDASFAPDYLLQDGDKEKPLLLVSVFPPGTDFEKVNLGDGWPVSLTERMTLLCRSAKVRLGLLTNGERWMLVNAPMESSTGHTSWYARLWFQEPITLQAFQTLLGVRRFFGPEEERLDALLDKSLEQQEEVTNTLGEQVRRAVEVLVQALDRADQDRNRELLKDISPAELYEAGLTVMMRSVFILCAEERGLLLLGDETYDQCYAISTIRSQLAADADRYGPEVLERRHDAWSRLLAVFRAVYGGIEHEALRLPALGGSLFDPDRFPFLEGRAKDTSWKDTPARPLPIDNRTVLLLLSALQVLEHHGGALLLSYKALDVEQIGHVYEGLLEHTVKRLPDTTLGFEGTKKVWNPNITLDELEALNGSDTEKQIKFLQEGTGRSKTAIKNGLKKEVDDATFGRIVAACGGDHELAERIRPFANLLRTDAWGDYIVYKADSYAVSSGMDRRETGTHYTPKSLTEVIVEKTLEPVAYIGPAEGKPRAEWKIKRPEELLDLKICDPAMGSGAFLVQVCRWLSKRLVESWGSEEKKKNFVTVDGEITNKLEGQEPLPSNLDERLLIAKRLIAEKCLYGVDINPLAVELAKMSIWLVTMSKGRPFGFLDHNLRSGDSLLGIHRLDQLTKLSMEPDKQHQLRVFGQNIERAVNEAIETRKLIRNRRIRDIEDVDYMANLDIQARNRLTAAHMIADAMIGDVLMCNRNTSKLSASMNSLASFAGDCIEGDSGAIERITKRARDSLSLDINNVRSHRSTFQWSLEFPEVFAQGGFDAIVSNPPFMGGKRISAALSGRYRDYIIEVLADGTKGNADLCAYFFLRNRHLLSSNGCYGMLATNSIAQGDTREVGLDQLEAEGFQIYRAFSSLKWPGKANLHVAIVWSTRNKWRGSCQLNDTRISEIPTLLSTEVVGDKKPFRLQCNKSLSFQGSNIRGRGFILSTDEKERLVHENSKNADVIFGYLTGEDINNSPQQSSDRYVINFFDWEEGKARKYNGPFQRVQTLVLPERKRIKHKGSREKCVRHFWRYDSQAKKLYKTIKGRDKVLVTARVSPTCAIAVVNNTYVFYETVIVFDLPVTWGFPLLQSSLHWEWVRQYTGTFGATTIRYTASDCFETFPFPTVTNDMIASGSEYLEYRKELLLNDNIGLTSLYNRFNDPSESSHSIKKLRELQVTVDRAVVLAYGWDDSSVSHGFCDTKQGVRFTLSTDCRRQILHSLLELNHERHEKGIKTGSAIRPPGEKSKNHTSVKIKSSNNNDLFEGGNH